MAPEPEALREALQPDLLKVFKPAFLGRCNVVIYYPLADDVLKKICGLKLRSIGKRLREAYGVPLQVDDSVPDAIVARCKEVESGARNIDNILSRTVLPELSARILARLAEGHEILQVKVGMNDDGSFRYDVG
jgi:type VI secretion system protein VasG